MRSVINYLSDELASESINRRGFMKLLAKLSLAAGALAFGAGEIRPALADTCCQPACDYGKDNSTCPPRNPPGNSFCCGTSPRIYGCLECLYQTGGVACYATYYGPGTSCPQLPQR